VSAFCDYVVFAHGGVPQSLSTKVFKVGVGLEFVFYWRHGETSADADKRRVPNEASRKLFQRLISGNTTPDAEERIAAGGNCTPYFAVGGVDLAGKMGVYRVTWTAAMPQRVGHLFIEFPATPSISLLQIRDSILKDYADQMNDNDTLRIHWISCRGVV